jgi:CPA2 family monovalent cation:H+ antiporter-2
MDHVPHLITDLALILGAAGFTTLVFRKIKQPLVLGYILAGLLVGPNFSLFPTIADIATIRIWADIGVIFLLFGLGLEFSFKKLVKVGGAASITGILETGAMVLIGYWTGQWLGWSQMDSLFAGGIIAISSTTIIIRAFDELGLKSQQFAGLVFGILVIEDLVAILMLVLLSTLAVSQQFAGTEMLRAVLKLGFFLTIWFLAGIFLIPTLLRRVRKLITDETLLVISIALCLFMVVLVTQVGFSAALGAFLMGSILAETQFVEKIEHLLQPVKDLFGAVFFVSVGMLIDPQMLLQYGGQVFLFSLVVIVGKSLNVTAGALIAGQPLKQSLQTGLSMTQIGEFSFIIATLGLSLKVTSNFLYPIAVAVSAITTFTTPFLIHLAEPINHWLERKLPRRWIASLNQYSAVSQNITQVSDWRLTLRTFASILFTNTVIVVSIILLTTRLLTPLARTYLGGSPWGEIATAIVSFSLMAPFLWALSVRKIRTPAYNNLWRNRKFNRGPLVGLEVGRIALGVVLVGFLLNQLFSSGIALVVATLLIVGVLPLFTQRLQATYARIEKRFIYNLNARELEKAAANQMMLPWDTHLAHFQVSPDSDIVGKTLTELAFREQYGVNIARIERGSKVIPVPHGQEQLFPYDKITVIGSDEQLNRFRPVVEVADSVITAPPDPEVTLKQWVVSSRSPFLGISIRESGIREKTKGLIIGIERQGERILNPDPDMVFLLGDIVWLAGHPTLIRTLVQESEKQSVN